MKDILTGVVTFLSGFVIFLMAREMQTPTGGFGPDVFPSFIGGSLALLGILLTVQGFRTSGKFQFVLYQSQFWIVPLTVLLTAVFITILSAFPFLLITPIYLLILILVGRFVKEGTWGRWFEPKLLSFIGVVSVLIYGVFKFIFHISLI